jgi:hypothetical protein
LRKYFTGTGFRALALLVGVAVAVMLVPGVAFGDDVSNTLDGTVDAAAETMSLTAGGPNGTTTLSVKPTKGDGKNGCNLAKKQSLGVSVNSSNTSVATVSPSSITFGSCNDTPTVTVTPVAGGTSNITITQVSNSTDGTFNLGPASFTVNVQGPPPNTPPVLTLPNPQGNDGILVVEATGPNGGAMVSDYQVTASDAEDGPLPADCSPPAGTVFAYGETPGPVPLRTAVDSPITAHSSCRSKTTRRQC